MINLESKKQNTFINVANKDAEIIHNMMFKPKLAKNAGCCCGVEQMHG
jgi:hypothetical protein